MKTGFTCKSIAILSACLLLATALAGCSFAPGISPVPQTPMPSPSAISTPAPSPAATPTPVPTPLTSPIAAMKVPDRDSTFSSVAELQAYLAKDEKNLSRFSGMSVRQLYMQTA
nr:hypothetical protein [bacterium]